MRRTIAVLTLALVGVGVPVLLNANAAQQITAKDVQPVHREGASDEQVKVAAETISERKYPVKLDHGRKLVEKKDEVTVRENVGGHHKHPPEPVTEVVTSAAAPEAPATEATEGDAPVGGTPPAYVAECESGGDPTAVSPGGTYMGKWQFDQGTWESVGGSGAPNEASEAEQDKRAAMLYAERGLDPWGCG